MYERFDDNLDYFTMVVANIIKVLFIVLSLAAASMLPINIIIEVKSCTYPPGLRDPALRGNRLSLSISINHSIHQGIDHQF